MKGFATRAVHTQPAKKDPHGSLRMPVYDGVAFEHDAFGQRGGIPDPRRFVAANRAWRFAILS